MRVANIEAYLEGWRMMKGAPKHVLRGNKGQY
jgi:hypothetical protein